MVGHRVARDAELEAVAIAVELGEAPAVDAVAPRVDLVDGDGGPKHVQVQAVVDIVPEPRVAQHVALARPFLAGEAVGALAILARIAVAIRVQVDDRIVLGRALKLKARFVVVVRREELVVVVRCVAGIDAVRTVDESECG